MKAEVGVDHLAPVRVRRELGQPADGGVDLAPGGGADRRARDAEFAGELGLRERLARFYRPVEDLLAQRDDHGLGGRDRGDGESGHQAAISVRGMTPYTNASTRTQSSSPLSSPR